MPRRRDDPADRAPPQCDAGHPADGPLAAVVLTLVFGGTLFWALGFAPLPTLKAFFIGPVSSLYGLTELLVKAVPLIIIAAGLAVGFRANIWNIGAEGQLIMGAIATAGVGLFAPQGLHAILMPLMFLAAMLAGMAWPGSPPSCGRALIPTRSLSP
ncbi:hypothetical protein MASR1M32_23900 [Rhodobacter sp.]